MLSVNHTLPSGPAVSPPTNPRPDPTKYVVIWPSGVIRLTAGANGPAANHTFPSAPAVMLLPTALPPSVGVNSVTWPAGVMRPTLSAAGSVNQRLPSGPAVMAGVKFPPEPSGGGGNSVTGAG